MTVYQTLREVFGDNERVNELFSELWQFVSANKLQIIMLIVLAVTAIGVFVGPRRSAKWQREEERHHKELRIHFKGLSEEVMNPIREANIPSSIESLSYLQPTGFSASLSKNSESFRAFEAHFPDEAKGWKDFESKANKYIGNHNGFIKEVQKALKQRAPLPSFSVMEHKTSSPLPFIDTKALSPLINIWLARTKGCRPSFDFEKAEIEEGTGGQGQYFVLKTNAYTCAYTTTREQAEQCKSMFITLQKDQGYEEKAAGLLSEWQELEKHFGKFKDEIRKRCDFIRDFGIGKDFKEREDCPICQKVFYRKKK